MNSMHKLRRERSAVRCMRGFGRLFHSSFMIHSVIRQPQPRDGQRCVVFGEGMNNKGRSAIHYLRSLALLAQFQGEIDAAIEHLQEAARVAEEVGLPGELWSICVELGGMYQKQGDESQADRTFA